MWEVLVKFVYYLMAYCLFNTTYTIVYVPYNSLTANITDDYDQRSSLTTARIVLANVGLILGAALFGLFAGDNTVISNLFVDAGCIQFEAIKKSYLEDKYIEHHLLLLTIYGLSEWIVFRIVVTPYWLIAFLQNAQPAKLQKRELNETKKSEN